MPEKTEERARETTAEGGKAALFFLARPSLRLNRASDSAHVLLSAREPQPQIRKRTTYAYFLATAVKVERPNAMTGLSDRDCLFAIPSL